MINNIQHLIINDLFFSIQCLRDLKDFMGVVFKLEPAKDPEDEDIILEQVNLSCMGIGYSHFSRRAT